MSKNVKSVAVYYETRFRTPTPFEHGVGLWVDRLGRGNSDGGDEGRFRVLGQYGAVRVIEGCGVLSLSTGREIPLAVEDVVILLPTEATAYRPLGGRWTTEWIVWNHLDAFAAFARSLPVSVSSPVLPGAGPALGAAWTQLAALMSCEDRAGAFKRASLLLGMLAEMAGGGDGVAENARRQDAVDDSIAYIHRHFDAPLRMPELAARAKMSPSTFRRHFTERTGRTPKQHLAAVRLAKAKEMLAAGGAVKRVAAACGYADVFHFMRCFKASTGVTARQFSGDGHFRADGRDEKRPGEQ